MRRMFLCLSCLCLVCVAAAAHATPITAGIYTLSSNTTADGYLLSGTVTMNSSGFATAFDVTLDDSALSDPTFIGTPNSHTAGGIDEAEFDGSTGQLILYYSPTLDTNGDIVLCTVTNPCSTEPDSYTHVYTPTNFQENLSNGTLDPGSSPSATPEPSSLALLGTGILGAAGVMRRRWLKA